MIFEKKKIKENFELLLMFDSLKYKSQISKVKILKPAKMCQFCDRLQSEFTSAWTNEDWRQYLESKPTGYTKFDEFYDGPVFSIKVRLQCESKKSVYLRANHLVVKMNYQTKTGFHKFKFRELLDLSQIDVFGIVHHDTDKISLIKLKTSEGIKIISLHGFLNH